MATNITIFLFVGIIVYIGRTKLEAAGKIDAEFTKRREDAAFRQRLADAGADAELIDDVMTRETVTGTR